MHVHKSNFHDYIVVLRTAFDLVCDLRVCCCVCVVCRPRAPVWELEDEGIQPDITSDKGRSSSDNRTSMTSTASTFSYGETKILYTLDTYWCVPYSGKLSREKTFTNFAVLEPPVKVFSTKFGRAVPCNL